ncbi:hypothetical protein VTI74DRAFT_237 [Chaetomium olivicolor]
METDILICRNPAPGHIPPGRRCGPSTHAASPRQRLMLRLSATPRHPTNGLEVGPRGKFFVCRSSFWARPQGPRWQFCQQHPAKIRGVENHYSGWRCSSKSAYDLAPRQWVPACCNRRKRSGDETSVRDRGPSANPRRCARHRMDKPLAVPRSRIWQSGVAQAKSHGTRRQWNGERAY